HLAISLADFTLRRPLELDWKQPAYFVIGLQQGSKQGLLGHIAKNNPFRRRYPGGFCSRGISVSFLPEFFDFFFSLRHGISLDELERAVRDINRFTPPPEAAVILKQIGEALSSVHAGPAWIEAKALELVSVILDWRGRIGEKNYEYLAEYDRAGIAEALRYIEEHLSGPLNLAMLAKTAAMSISKFTALFRRRTGLSAAAYISRLRMEQAMNMLKTTAVPIGEIAALSGYKRPASFSAAFREQFGAAPGAFRGT
ncbi:MAG: AraC family transcriptional regulator, partial [Treponema sp.]|nr:AraC family transcriptional regulator [Treponema sp.]